MNLRIGGEIWVEVIFVDQNKIYLRGTDYSEKGMQGGGGIYVSDAGDKVVFVGAYLALDIITTIYYWWVC